MAAPPWAGTAAGARSGGGEHGHGRPWLGWRWQPCGGGEGKRRRWRRRRPAGAGSWPPMKAQRKRASAGSCCPPWVEAAAASG